MNLYIDCDDTLVLWLDEWGQPLEGQNPYGGGSQKWILNEPLIDAIKKWYISYQPPIRGEVIIWSGGGAQYAYRWAELAFMRDPRDIETLDSRRVPLPEIDRPLRNLTVSGKDIRVPKKDIRVPKHDDIVVDDQKLVIRSRPTILTPDKFIDRMGTRYYDWTGNHVRTPSRASRLSS